MSRLEELIAELCPDGVEYFQLKTLCTRQKGTSITAGEMKTLDKPNAPIRIFAGGNTTAYVEYGDIPDSAVITKPSIIVKSRGNIGFEYYEKPFSHKNEMWSYSTEREDIVLKYIYYYLEHHTLDFQAKAKSGKLPQISTPDTDNYKIPLPPLEVQREIVRILDSFTELDAELNAELDARKKQYEYYRDDLLTFTESHPFAEMFRDGVEYKTLGEVAECCAGATPKTGVAKYWENGTIPWMSSGEVNKGIIFDTDVKITELAYESCSTKLVPANTVVVALAGQGKTRGKVARTRIELCTNQSLCSIIPHPILDSDYLYFYLDSQYRQLRAVSTGDGSRGGLNLKMIRKYKIPLPPLEVQREIVRILDAFTELTAELTAELDARKKQYEHYRDQLLTFEKKTA